MRLSRTQHHLLLAIAAGRFLKSHRDIEGRKVFRLHALDGSSQTVRRATVEALGQRGLIDSNKKFPAATYWLTEAGQKVVSGRQP